MVVQDRIVAYLQRRGGRIEDAGDVADVIGTGLDVPGDRIRSALGALEARGLLVATYFAAELTDEGRAHVIEEASEPSTSARQRSESAWETFDRTRKAPLASVGAGGTADRASAGDGGSPPASQRPTPVPTETTSVPAAAGTREEEGMAKSNGAPTIGERIVEAVRKSGGTISDAGGAKTRIAELIGASPTTVGVTIDKLARQGALVKGLRGHLVTEISLGKGGTSNGDGSGVRVGSGVPGRRGNVRGVPRGSSSASDEPDDPSLSPGAGSSLPGRNKRAAQQAPKGARRTRNGVRKGRVRVDGRKLGSARRDSAPADPSSSAKARRGRPPARVLRGSGQSAAANATDHARAMGRTGGDRASAVTDEADAAELEAFQALLRLTPPLRRRVIAFVEIASASEAE